MHALAPPLPSPPLLPLLSPPFFCRYNKNEAYTHTRTFLLFSLLLTLPSIVALSVVEAAPGQAVGFP